MYHSLPWSFRGAMQGKGAGKTASRPSNLPKIMNMRSVRAFFTSGCTPYPPPNLLVSMNSHTSFSRLINGFKRTHSSISSQYRIRMRISRPNDIYRRLYPPRALNPKFPVHYRTFRDTCRHGTRPGSYLGQCRPKRIIGCV